MEGFRARKQEESTNIWRKPNSLIWIHQVNEEKKEIFSLFWVGLGDDRRITTKNTTKNINNRFQNEQSIISDGMRQIKTRVSKPNPL
jgi:hypothetical protein